MAPEEMTRRASQRPQDESATGEALSAYQATYKDLTPEEQAEVDEWWGDLRAGYVEIEMESVESLSPRARQVVEEGTRRLLRALWH